MLPDGYEVATDADGNLIVTVGGKEYNIGSEKSQKQTGTVVPGITSLHFRSGPGMDQEIIGYLHSGDTVEIVEKCGDWYKVNFNGKTGYAHGKYLNVTDSAKDSSMFSEDALKLFLDLMQSGMSSEDETESSTALTPEGNMTLVDDIGEEEDKSSQTLDYTQALYEKKLVTYPRTDSRYLTDDMAPLVPELVSVIQQSFQIQPDAPAPVNAAQVINSKKVTDHHAIIPTKTAAGYDISSLPSGEQAILTMLAVRLICAVGTPCRYAETIVEAECAGQKFRTKGKTVTDMGWRQYAGKPVEDAEKNAEAGDLPELSEGMTLELAGVDLKEGKTSPPKRFTEDLLLSAMESASSDEFPAGVERKGIGTPATRAAIIEKLVQKGFIERRGDKKTKYLCSTDKGNALVTVVPEQIQSPSMTADWEEKLLKIEHGEYDSDAFMGEISSMVSGLVKTYEAVKGADVLMQSERKVIGSCPACGSDVCETGKGWFCMDKSCKFALWKENRFFQTLGKQMTEELAKQLVNQGKARLTHCYSKKSNRYYDTTVHVETGEDGAAAFKLEFGGKK